MTGGSREVLARAIAIWWRKIPEWVIALKEGFLHSNLRQIQETAHTLRGAAGNIGALSISRCAGRLEGESTAENLSSMAPVFDLIVLDIERLRHAIERHPF